MVSAFWTFAPGAPARNPTAAGAGITIPVRAAKRSIRCPSSSAARFARNSSLRL